MRSGKKLMLSNLSFEQREMQQQCYVVRRLLVGMVHQLEVEADPGARVVEGVGPGEVLVAVKVTVEVHQHVVLDRDREDDREVRAVMVEAEAEGWKCSNCAGERGEDREE